LVFRTVLICTHSVRIDVFYRTCAHICIQINAAWFADQIAVEPSSGDPIHWPRGGEIECAGGVKEESGILVVCFPRRGMAVEGGILLRRDMGLLRLNEDTPPLA